MHHHSQRPSAKTAFFWPIDRKPLMQIAQHWKPVTSSGWPTRTILLLFISGGETKKNEIKL